MSTNSVGTRFTTFAGRSLLHGKPIDLHVSDGNHETTKVREQLATREAPRGTVTADDLRAQHDKFRQQITKT